jgi:hypothetical protein
MPPSCAESVGSMIADYFVPTVCPMQSPLVTAAIESLR